MPAPASPKPEALAPEDIELLVKMFEGDFQAKQNIYTESQRVRLESRNLARVIGQIQLALTPTGARFVIDNNLSTPDRRRVIHWFLDGAAKVRDNVAEIEFKEYMLRVHGMPHIETNRLLGALRAPCF